MRNGSTSKNNVRRWLAPAAVVLGLVCIVAGFGLLTWVPGSAFARVTATTRATTLVTAAATATAAVSQLPTLALTVAPAPTPTAAPTMSQAISLAETGATFTLTIVHSNDTWGYTHPCG